MYAIVALWLAVTAAFLLSRLTGDPALQIASPFSLPEDIAEIRALFGFDRPLGTQYVEYMGGLIRGDFGESLQYGVSNIDLILGRLPATIYLASVSLLIAVVIGIPLGVLAASKSGSRVDRIVSGLTLTGQSAPAFWIGMLLIVVFAVWLGWFPAGQARQPNSVILPAVTLAVLLIAQIARLTRSSMIEALHQDFTTAAVARGLPRWRVIWRHALRNAALPVLTIVGLQTGRLLSGAVTVEFVFAWPGLGTLITQAVQATDFTLVQALVVIGALTFVVVNLGVDLLYFVVDPRLRRPGK